MDVKTNLQFMELDASRLNSGVNWQYVGGFALGGAAAAGATYVAVLVIT